MKVSVVSDIHGNFDDLARVAETAEQLVVLGDLLDYIDYYDPGGGVLGAIFGAERVGRMITLRASGDFEAYHAYDRELWATISDPKATLDEVVAEQYESAIACLPESTLLTLGNVDVKHVWNAVAPDHLRLLDGEIVEIGGIRLGFVGGGAVRNPPTDSPWRSFDRTYEAFAETLSTLGAFDVLCSHVPPRIDALRYDIVAGRSEMYGPGLLELIEQRRPGLALSGHVHHPKASEVRVGGTRCVNVGYFKRNPVPFTFDSDDGLRCLGDMP
ncbi:metallophosphoesterase family protein [Microbacterium aurum]